MMLEYNFNITKVFINVYYMCLMQAIKQLKNTKTQLLWQYFGESFKLHLFHF